MDRDCSTSRRTALKTIGAGIAGIPFVSTASRDASAQYAGYEGVNVIVTERFADEIGSVVDRIQAMYPITRAIDNSIDETYVGNDFTLLGAGDITEENTWVEGLDRTLEWTLHDDLRADPHTYVVLDWVQESDDWNDFDVAEPFVCSYVNDLWYNGFVGLNYGFVVNNDLHPGRLIEPELKWFLQEKGFYSEVGGHLGAWMSWLTWLALPPNYDRPESDYASALLSWPYAAGSATSF